MAQSPEAFETQVRAHGLGSVADRGGPTLAACDAALDASATSTAGRWTIWAPGRLEIFGKHTDYAGGRSLLMAVEDGFWMRAAPRDDAQVRVTDCRLGESFTVGLDAGATAVDGHWSNYVATVARRVARNFPDAPCGVDIALWSTLPPAAGASSSSALLIGVFLAIASVNRLEETALWRDAIGTPSALAAYLGAMENGLTFGALAGDTGVGTLGGAQDHTAIVCSSPGTIVDFAWMPVRQLGAYALPDSYCFVVGASGIVAEKSAGARERYNRVSRMVRHLVSAWNVETGRDDGSLAAAVESSPSAIGTLRDIALRGTVEFPAAALSDRLEQFVRETYTLIPAAAAAILAHDWSALGALAAESQRGADTQLGNQVPETRALVRLALAEGALAASAFGAGFGGSVWALVPAAASEAFQARWSAGYAGEFPDAARRAMFFRTAAGPGATAWPDPPSV